jgi:hypothetical protein
MTTITARSILASARADNPSNRIDTLLLRYPRCIHSEFMTHRMFSRNASSSRAIPVERLTQDVIDDPFVPLFWGKNQKGMQANEECNEKMLFAHDGRTNEPIYRTREEEWLAARDIAVIRARKFAAAGYHKQIVNRLIEPFSHITVVCTSTNWSNFLHLRDHPDAEPHIQMLARAMRMAITEAAVQWLQPGEWHLPFARSYAPGEVVDAIKLSVARCASTSYNTVEGFEMTLARAIALHDKLVGMDPLHASPCEHQAKVDDYDHLLGCFVNGCQRGNLAPGWVQYRKTLEGECR